MRKFQCLLFLLKRPYIYYCMICMTVPLTTRTAQADFLLMDVHLLPVPCFDTRKIACYIFVLEQWDQRNTDMGHILRDFWLTTRLLIFFLSLFYGKKNIKKICNFYKLSRENWFVKKSIFLEPFLQSPSKTSKQTNTNKQAHTHTQTHRKMQNDR